MPRQRRTGPPNQRPQNVGAGRNVQMRNNQRAARPMTFQQQTFQGCIGQNAGASPQQPGLQRPSAQQGNIQCPAGQQPGRMPDGNMGCVPAAGPGQAGAPRRAGGAGVPTGITAQRNKQGY